jgi:hypothetical protein
VGAVTIRSETVSTKAVIQKPALLNEYNQNTIRALSEYSQSTFKYVIDNSSMPSQFKRTNILNIQFLEL